jgi:hypothetical protein
MEGTRATLGGQVKEPVTLPFVFLFILLCATILLAALDLLSAWGTLEAGARPFTLGWAIARVPRSVLEVMIPSFVLSILIVGIRMARKPISRLLGLVIVLGVSYVALVNGMIWMRSLASRTAAASEAPRRVIRASTFLRLGEARAAVSSIEGSAVSGVLLFDPSRGERRFAVFASGSVARKDGVVTLMLPGRKPLELTEGIRGNTAAQAIRGNTAAQAIRGNTAAPRSGPSEDALFAPERFAGRLLRDIRTLTGDFEALLAGSLGRFFAACFSLLFLCTASLVLLRLTRWPLANLMLLALAFRGYFLLYHFLVARVAPEVGRVVKDSIFAGLFPAGAMAALGVVLLLVDILFIPADRWRPEGTR